LVANLAAATQAYQNIILCYC